ncbi:MAG: YceI family protein [Terriglobales bacterium]|jgi:polyisoprenoid-binding protein YceI
MALSPQNAVGTEGNSVLRYLIDPKGSTFGVQAFSTGVLSAFGHSPKIAIRIFEGRVSFTVDGNVLRDVNLEVRINTNSLEVADDISEKDRQEIERQMHNDVLETDRFPTILFEWSGTASGNEDLFWVKLDGALTLHGVTHTLPVSARVIVLGDSLRASGDFTVRQSDYEIAIVKVAGGAIRLKDEIKGMFDIVARKQA